MEAGSGRLVATRQLIRRLKPDVVHTWIFAANCYGRDAAFRERVPVVIAGERCVDRWKRNYEFWIDRRLAKRTQRIATNSQAVVDFYVEHGIERGKFTVIPNGIDPRCVANGPTREEMHRTLGLPPDAKLIGAVGRLWPQKRYKDLIWAIELLRTARGGDCHLAILGDGPQREMLEEYADGVGISPNVHFLGAREDAARLIPAFDCFWLASDYEGQSNAVMEAMCAGTPAIVSDIPGNRDLIDNDETGWLIPVGDAAGYAKMANVVIEQPERARQIAEAARRRMETEFTLDKMVQRHADLYRTLVQGG